MSTENEDVIARVRAALAEDPRTSALDVEVCISDDVVILDGAVDTEERHVALERMARRAVRGRLEVQNQTRVASYAVSPRPAPVGPLRIAAVGDLHIGIDSRGTLAPRLRAV